MVNPRQSVLILLVLLMLPSLSAPAGSAQSGEAVFGIRAVQRAGDNVTIETLASRTVTSVTISLVSGGTLIALPEHYESVIYSGDRDKLTFQLLQDVKSATVSFRWVDSESRTRTQTIGVPIPPKSEPDVGQPRVIVDEVVRSGTNLQLNLTNIGDAPTGQLVVSIENANQRKIGSPYYRVLASMAAGASANATFTVPDKLAEAVVALEYNEQTERVHVAVHDTGATATDDTDAVLPVNVTLATDLPFREVDLGRTIDFAVRVTNQGRHALVNLAVDDLPDGYSYRFFVGGSAVPSLLLGNQTRTVTLSITVPNSEAEVDRLIEFATIARVNGTEHARLPMGVTVRGVGQLEVSGQDLFAQVPAGGVKQFTVSVTNTGSAPLFDVELEARRIYGWTLRFEPRRLDRLDPGETKAVSVEVRAPDVIAPGQYTTDLSARSGDSTSRQVSIAVEIPAGEQSGGWLWYVFLGLIASTLGVAWWKRRRG